MLRKLTLGLFAAASLSATALIPSAASAHGMHFHGFHGGFGFHRFYGGPAFVVGGDYDDCLRRRIVDTRWGPRVRVVNICAY